jgi:hypothetical protein
MKSLPASSHNETTKTRSARPVLLRLSELNNLDVKLSNLEVVYVQFNYARFELLLVYTSYYTPSVQVVFEEYLFPSRYKQACYMPFVCYCYNIESLKINSPFSVYITNM